MFRQYEFIKIWIWFWREINYLLFHILKLRLKEEYIYNDHKIFIFFSVNVIISLMNYVLLVHFLKS